MTAKWPLSYMLSFFLYPILPHTSVFGREVYHAFEHHPNRTHEHATADFFITTVGNECNYPNFDMRGCTTTTPLVGFAKDHPFYRAGNPHVTFFDTTPTDLPAGLINIAYTGRGIVIPPPAITNVPFKGARRRARIFFQGNIDRTPRRRHIIEHLRQNVRALVKERGTQNEYKHYLQTSEYALVVSGDLPWSYRLTEVIQSGAIPIFIIEDNHPLPMSDEIDWTLCADFVSIKQLAHWSSNETSAGLKQKCLRDIRPRFFDLREVAQYVLRAVSKAIVLA